MDTRALQMVAKASAAAFLLGGPILDAVTRSQEAVAKAEASGEGSLAEEAKRQQIVMEFQAHTARVAQELAIAQRVASAHEVEIEEYYEGTGKGTVGVQLDKAALLAGLSGEGQRVTRRIIKLKGGSAASDEIEAD